MGVHWSGRGHPDDRCAWCGNTNRHELRETVHKDTKWRALICTDHNDCIRRQMQQKLERSVA